MTGRPHKSRHTKNSNCVVCSRPVFRFERRVKVADLDQHDKAACASVLRTQDQDSGGILCVSCYRKLQQGTDDCVDSGNHQQDSSGTRRDSAQTTPVPPPHDNLQTSEAPNPSSSPLSPRCSSTIPEQVPQASAEAAAVAGSQRAQQNPQPSAEAAAVAGSKRVQQNPQPSAEAAAVAGSQREVSSNSRASTPEDATMDDERAGVPSWMMVHGWLAVVAGTVVGLGLGVGWIQVACLAGVAVLLGIVIVCVKPWNLIRTWFRALRAAGNNPGEDAPQLVASAIDAGSSLAGMKLLGLMQDGHSVTCGIEVENWTRFALVQPRVQLSCGSLSLAPSNIAPASSEAMVARKPSGRINGSYGTVSWLIQPMNRRLVVMWSAPYNFDFHSNWLAVGLTAVGTTEHAPGNAWFEQMYRCSSTPELTFQRGEYNADIGHVVCRDGGLEVEGIMSTDHKAAVKVILRPLDPNNFAPSIQKKMLGRSAQDTPHGKKPGEAATPLVASAIDAGSSLAGTTLLGLMQDSHSVTCGIEVENWTRFALVQPRVQLSCGSLSLAPSNIAPASSEAMVARKPSGRVKGSYGTVSWLIQPMNRRLVVMWSAPYNFDFYSNWLAVGLTAVATTEHAPGNSWFEQMYRRSSTPELTFQRGEYNADIGPAVCRDGGLEVEGIMATDHKAAVKVILRPLDPNNFAPSIQKKMKAA